jgi:hypothetical protein
MIFAIDPGPAQSGYAVMSRAATVLASGVLDNADMLRMLIGYEASGATLAVEMIASYGMPVGREVFETCVWVGRFVQAWHPRQHELVYRKDVKLHLCGSPRAKDANIRQALIDRLGAPGTKGKPGPTYGVKSHAWPALAVAVTVADSRRLRPAT